MDGSYYVKNVSSVSGGATSANLPITFITYSNAVRFANWLHNGQGDGSTETGAYTISEGQLTQALHGGSLVTMTTAPPHTLTPGDKVSVFSSDIQLNGTFAVLETTDTTFTYQSPWFSSTPRNVTVTGSMSGISERHPDARYWIPTENEWYKAAYYDPSPEGPADDYWLFPWRSDSSVSGQGNYYVVRYVVTTRMVIEPYYTYLTDVRRYGETPSYYGTLNQAGNVEEWTEGDVFSGGPHTRGGHWNKADFAPSQNYAFQRIASYSAPVAGQTAEDSGPHGRGFRVATVANPPADGLRNGDKIRFYPRVGHNRRMVGGVFEVLQGGIDRPPYRVLHTITEIPADGWTEVSVDFGEDRFFRYRSPDGGHGNVAEIEFSRSGAKVIAAASGTPGSWNNQGSTFDKALDGNVDTFFDAQQPNEAYVQLDTGQGTPFGTPAGFDHLRVSNANGSGNYRPGQRVDVFAFPPSGQYFAGWEGFTSILDDPTARSTYATIPGIGVDLTLNATFKPLPPGSHILDVVGGSGDGIYPTGSMVVVRADPAPPGRPFVRWTGDTTILSNPFLPTTTAITPSMNVEVAASYSEAGLNDKIRFHPRSGHTNRMVGGVFEATGGDPITEPYRTLYTVTSNPPEGWSEVNVSLVRDELSDPAQYRYLRYRGPNSSHGNVAEIEFYRNGVKVTGTGFGTPGSWSNSGSTFDKALDGDVNTFFDAPNADGNYVGVDDTEALPFQTDRIRYYPREGFENGMTGGVFEGSNGDPVTGPYVTRRQYIYIL